KQCVGVPVTCPQAPVVRAAAAPVGPANDPGPTCQRPVKTSALTAGNVQPLATHTVGDLVTFTIPPGTDGFSIVSQAVNAQITDITVISSTGNFTLPNSVVPEVVRTPTPTTVFFDDRVNPPADPATALAEYGGLSPSTGAFTVPNTTAALQFFANGVPPGTWSFTVGDFA